MRSTKFYKIFRRIVVFIIQRIDFFIVEFHYYFRRLFFSKVKYSKKSVLVLVSQLCNGGAERVAANIADELSKKYEVILVTYSSKTKNDYPCSVKRIVINEKNAKFFKYCYVVKNLKKLKKKYHITHCISFCSKANYLNVVSQVNDQTIISIRSYLKYSEVDQQYYRLNKIAGKYCDKEVVVSEQLIKEQVEEYYANDDKMKVIHNFVDKDKIDQKLKEKNDLKLSPKTFINVGRLSSQKGQIYLIRAFRKVVDRYRDAKLIILGQGELYEKLEDEIRTLHMENNVQLLGYQSNPFVYMKKSFCFVLSSFFEGMPNVVLEAMYTGLPIISTDCISGVRDILSPNSDMNKRCESLMEEEYGMLVPIPNYDNFIDCMSQAMIRMLEDKELYHYYQKQSKKRIKEFLKDRIMKEWFGIVKE